MYCSAARYSMLVLFISIGLALSGASASLGPEERLHLHKLAESNPSINFDIYFYWQSFEIPPAMYSRLDLLVEALASSDLRCSRFEIRGYADVAEHVGFSMELSLLRAGRVMRYLMSKGISRERLRPRGSGAQTEKPNAYVRIVNIGTIKGCSESPQGNE
jgi:outer membrane protein OmpA-like peptidoglycan-associated protein